MTPELENDLITLLAHVYRRVPWGKIHTRHGTYDVWNHRIRAAATRPTLGEFLSKLCNHFGLQSLSIEAIELGEKLRPHEDELLDFIDHNHIPCGMRSAMRAQQWRAAANEPKEDT